VPYITVKQPRQQIDAVGDGRFRPQCCFLTNWTKHARHLLFWPICSIARKTWHHPQNWK